MNEMWIDPLVREIRKRRKDLMAEFDYDPRKVVESMKRDREKYSDRLVHPDKKHELVARKEELKGAKK